MAGTNQVSSHDSMVFLSKISGLDYVVLEDMSLQHSLALIFKLSSSDLRPLGWRVVSQRLQGPRTSASTLAVSVFFPVLYIGVPHKILINKRALLLK